MPELHACSSMCVMDSNNVLSCVSLTDVGCFNRTYWRNVLLQGISSLFLSPPIIVRAVLKDWTSESVVTRETGLLPDSSQRRSPPPPPIPFGRVLLVIVLESSWNVMAHRDAWEGKWRGNWRMGWIASTLHATSEHGVSSITNADTHISVASSRLNWRPRRFKWTCPFRRKTKSVFCACAITFQLASTLCRQKPQEGTVEQGRVHNPPAAGHLVTKLGTVCAVELALNRPSDAYSFKMASRCSEK